MSEPPLSVRRAVQAMKAGMVASLAGIAVNLTSANSVRPMIAKLEPNASPAQVTADQRVFFGELIAAGLLEAALWLWMAQSCREGKGWARTLSTVVFAIYTVWTVATVAGGASGIDLIYSVLVWLIGLAAVRFLWQGSSSEYFRKSAR
ncbi:MAG: hypothetical protein FWE35_18195 [Streptosporangiales bacterium]|nr:hypothetical protein [Streptosporangiales bacterium]